MRVDQLPSRRRMTDHLLMVEGMANNPLKALRVDRTTLKVDHLPQKRKKENGSDPAKLDMNYKARDRFKNARCPTFSRKDGVEKIVRAICLSTFIFFIQFHRPSNSRVVL